MVDKSNSPNFDAIFLRIKKETSIRSIRQLSEIIGKKHPTVSAAKAKDNFSPSWAYEIEKKYGLLTRWIMTGEGPKRLNEQKEESRKYEILNEAEEWLDEQVRRNPDRKAWFELNLLDAFPAFKEWRRKKDHEESDEDESLSRKVA